MQRGSFVDRFVPLAAVPASLVVLDLVDDSTLEVREGVLDLVPAWLRGCERSLYDVLGEFPGRTNEVRKPQQGNTMLSVSLLGAHGHRTLIHSVHTHLVVGARPRVAPFREVFSQRHGTPVRRVMHATFHGALSVSELSPEARPGQKASRRAARVTD